MTQSTSAPGLVTWPVSRIWDEVISCRNDGWEILVKYRQRGLDFERTPNDDIKLQRVARLSDDKYNLFAKFKWETCIAGDSFAPMSSVTINVIRPSRLHSNCLHENQGNERGGQSFSFITSFGMNLSSAGYKRAPKQTQ